MPALRLPVHRFRPGPALKALAATIGVLVAAVLAANAWVLLTTRGEASSDVATLPHADAAIVLGALVRPDGTMSSMLADRVSRAAALWKAGKVDRVIVSGDHHRWAYDEPGTMRLALRRAGVPARAIFTDHAGFDTWASMVRARRVFGVGSAIVVTQGFHMPRALFLARAAGLRAHGLTTDLHGYGAQGKLSGLREIVARVKAAGDATVHPAVLLGPRHLAGTPARATWGPAPPAGTPPAGAPR